MSSIFRKGACACKKKKLIKRDNYYGKQNNLLLFRKKLYLNMISDKREVSHLVNGKFTTNLIREIHQWQLKGLRTYKLFRFYEHIEQRKIKYLSLNSPKNVFHGTQR